MRKYLKKLYENAQFIREEDGQDLIEYVFLVALIALACVVSIQGVATALNTAFGKVSTKIGATVT